MYEGGIRVPMIARWPGRIRAGSRSGLPWYFADFFATAAELSGGKLPAGLDGLSVVPALLGRGRQQRHEFMYWELPRYISKTAEFAKETPMQAVRMGEWKAVRPKPGAPLELYNLETDIGERNNVAAPHSEGNGAHRKVSRIGARAAPAAKGTVHRRLPPVNRSAASAGSICIDELF